MNLIFNYKLHVNYDKKRIMFRCINKILYLPGCFENFLNTANVKNSEDLVRYIREDPKVFMDLLDRKFTNQELENELNRLFKKIGETPDIKIKKAKNILDFIT